MRKFSPLLRLTEAGNYRADGNDSSAEMKERAETTERAEMKERAETKTRT